MKIGMIGPSYTASSNVIADEECINWFAETIETPGAQTKWSYLRTPGLAIFTTFSSGPVRGQCYTGTRYFVVAAETLYEVASDGTQTVRGTVADDGTAVSIVYSSIQLLIVSAGHAYCYTLATDTLLEVTSDLAGTPVQVEYSDGYFVVCFSNSNKFQVSDILDGTTWPGLQVNEVSVFAENIVSLLVNHRELWVFGQFHTQPYQDTGSDQVFDVIPGALVETGSAAPLGRNRVDNTVFCINQDERGGRVAWRANGYTPERISTHAVETALASYPDISGMVTYSYQEAGHLFWVLYIPGTDCTWVYDVSTKLWAKRAEWIGASSSFVPHYSWNHAYVFGKQLVGDWNSGNVYEMSRSYYDDAGAEIRRVRRSPIIVNEMARVYHAEITLDFAPGLGPQPPLEDGNGNPRQPQAMIRWSDNRGSTWGNEHILNCGFAGQYNTRVIQRRLGQSRYRVYEITVSDPIDWTLVDAYLRIA